MQIIPPSVEILPELKPLEKIELCGRVCYKSEGKIAEGSARKFAERILTMRHTSVFEHTRVVMPIAQYKALREANNIQTVPSVDRVDFYCDQYGGTLDIELNGRDFVNHVSRDLDILEELPTAKDYMSVRFISDIGISRQIQRHRTLSFSQESTRYVSYKNGVSFISPVPFEWADKGDDDPRYRAWSLLCTCAEQTYQKLIKEGCNPQEARLVLPLSAKTDFVVTGTYHWWGEFLKLRMAKGADPQLIYLLQQLVKLSDFPKEIKYEDA